jgi:hypothetical protein
MTFTKCIVCLWFVFTTAGCGGGLWVRRDDLRFQLSQARLEKTQEGIATGSAPLAERQLFMQAEGFYRYRFELPERGTASYLAEAAAVTLDFPALQTVAGSLDLTELRLKSYDGAVHLWESLLMRNPDTQLRALVLYRLGWAYRNTGAAGLPRESGDDAFAALIAEQPHSPLASLAKHAMATRWKSRTTATALSVMPGLGQLYVGETRSGVTRLSIAALALAAVVVPAYVGFQRREELAWRRDWPLLSSGLCGLLVLSFSYTSSYQAAARSVVEWNEGVEAEFDARHPETP